MKRKNDPLAGHGVRTPAEPEINVREDVVYQRRRLIVCKFCGRARLADGGQAVVVRATKEGVAYVRSKCCDRNWSLPMR